MAQGILRLDGGDTGAERHRLALLPLRLAPREGPCQFHSLASRDWL